MIAITKTQLENDLKYIENLIIAKQNNGKYCKFSKILNTIVIVDMTENDFITYWLMRYKFNSEEDISRIIEACKNKIQNGLITKEKMIDLVINSKDVDSEKVKILSKLGVKYII